VHTRVLLAGADDLDDSEVSPERVAAYVAKYSAKGSHEGITARDASPDTLRSSGVPEHLVQLVLAARALGRRGGHWSKLGRWSHMLGFGGHFVTKSRAYSTTLGALRQARADFRAQQAGEDQTIPVLAEWEYAGSGYSTPGDALLAASIEAGIREEREAIRIERARDPSLFEAV
jgi:hypothetical protein